MMVATDGTNAGLVRHYGLTTVAALGSSHQGVRQRMQWLLKGARGQRSVRRGEKNVRLRDHWPQGAGA